MFFFLNDAATTEIYTLSLHDALPISAAVDARPPGLAVPQQVDQGAVEPLRVRVGLGEEPRDDAGTEPAGAGVRDVLPGQQDRKSTRLNSSHANISYAVFCLKKKKITL